jgi:hypothetical protein
MSKIGREIIEGLEDFVGKLKRDEPLTVSRVDPQGKIVRRKVKPSELNKSRIRDSMHDRVIDSMDRGLN